MKIEKYIPGNILKPFIKTFMIIESEDRMENRILPDTSIVMAFRFKGRVTYRENNIEKGFPASAITGLRKSARLLNYLKQTANLLVVFNEGGAAAFFKEPIHELFEASLPLESIIHRHKLREIEERLAAAKSNLQRISIVERFLISELKETQSDLLVLNAAQKIKAANGDVKIKDLVKVLYISRDPFEKRFRRLIGTSPKQFAAIVRLRNLIDNRLPAESLTGAALAAGYFDQAHFIKDFKSFTGQTPQVFFKSSAYW